MCIRDRLIPVLKPDDFRGYYLVKASNEQGDTGYYFYDEREGTIQRVWSVSYTHLDVYKRQVVAYEMSNSFPLEALKAQAVCARGYAANKIKTSGAYDIVDTTVDQVYKGYEPAYQRVIQAVNETKGHVLTYNGKIISTFYACLLYTSRCV